MNLELIITLSILVIVTFVCVLYIFKYINTKKDLKQKTDKYHKNKKSFSDYTKRIKHHLEGGNQLRKGFIERNLVKDQGGPNEVKFDVIVEVQEVERTIKRSKIEVIDLKIKNTNTPHITLPEAKGFFDGWVYSNTIDWKQSINGREEIIDQILDEIEKDEELQNG